MLEKDRISSGPLNKSEACDNDGNPAGDASRDYWHRQNEALTKARTSHEKWTKQRRSSGQNEKGAFGWKRVTYSLPRAEAQAKAREFLQKYPKAAYWSEVESWRELPGDVIEFTMRRLPTAD